MNKSQSKYPELYEIKKEIADWPEWMQREARFEGNARTIGPVKEAQDDKRRDESDNDESR